MGEQHHKETLDNGNANNQIPPPDQNEVDSAANGEESEELTQAEYQQLDRQLDALFTALDDIESKNDNIHAQLLQLLDSNREIRKQLNNEVEKEETGNGIGERRDN